MLCAKFGWNWPTGSGEEMKMWKIYADANDADDNPHLVTITIYLIMMSASYPFIDKKKRTNIDKIQKSSSPEPLSQYQPILAQSILGWGFKWKKQ